MADFEKQYICHFLEMKFYPFVVARVGLILHASLNVKILGKNSLKFLVAAKLCFHWSVFIKSRLQKPPGFSQGS